MSTRDISFDDDCASIVCTRVSIALHVTRWLLWQRSRKKGAKSKDIKERLKVAEKNHDASSFASKRVMNHLTVRQGFRDHVATDGSTDGSSMKVVACAWSVVQLDHDEQLEPMRGMYGTLDAVLELQHTIKRAELMAFFCLFKKKSFRPYDGSRW